jgi:hypothetical protein
MIMPSEIYPRIIHLPTGILPKSFVERATPVNAPNGESKRERPRLASVNPSRYLIPGIAATHVPNKRLEAENKNPTANAGFSFMNDKIFLIIIPRAISYELRFLVKIMSS